jgi:hypothetical protein
MNYKEYIKYLLNEDKKLGELNDNFKKWFGDSKVVDSSGNPLIVYHGSNSQIKFKEFLTNKPSWFTTSENYANAFISNKVKGLLFKVYIKIKNPLYIGDIDGCINKPKLERLSEFTNIDYDILENLKIKYLASNILNITNSEEFKKIFISKGYDGLEARESKGLTTYAVFNPNHIKSIYNNGDWDINNPNIYK